MFFRGKRRGKKRVAVFVDGPNVIRREFNLNLDNLTHQIKSLGDLKIGKVFLNQFASNKLVEAIISQGFEPSFGLGEKDSESDVDVYMATHVMEAIFNPNIDSVVLVTRDADFLPVVQKAKEKGKEVIIIAPEPGFATSLKNAADSFHILNE